MTHPETQFVHIHYTSCSLGENGFEYEILNQTLDQYMRYLRTQGINPIMEYRMPKSGFAYLTIPEEYRRFFRAMVHLVSDLHREGLSTRGISINFMGVVDDGAVGRILKVKELRFNTNPTEATRIADYKAVLDIIRDKIIGPSLLKFRGMPIKGCLPYMHSFLELLENPGDLVSPLPHHIAIVSCQERTTFIDEVADKRYTNAALFDPSILATCDAAEKEDSWTATVSFPMNHVHIRISVITSCSRRRKVRDESR